MNNLVHVELVPIQVPADPQPRPDSAGQTTNRPTVPDAGEISPDVTVWMARINGVEVPVDGYAVEHLYGPQVTVSLVISADSLSIGDPSLSSKAPHVRAAAQEKPKNERRPWGSGGPDPREGIPGWRPEPSLGEQVAGNAEAVAQ